MTVGFSMSWQELAFTSFLLFVRTAVVLLVIAAAVAVLYKVLKRG